MSLSLPRRSDLRLHQAALLAAALQLGPALAHLLELPAKLTLARDEYLVAQRLYDGWALLGILVFLALGLTLALWLLRRRRGRPAGWVAAALGCQLAAQAVFWSFTWPANQATANWRRLPDAWEGLRDAWEWSHAAGALLTLGAFVCLLLALRPGAEEGS